MVQGTKLFEALDAKAADIGPLAVCLLDAIHETENRFDLSSNHLRAAVALLGRDTPPPVSFSVSRATTAHTLAAFLTFLLPEVRLHSIDAARSVDDAILALQSHAGTDEPSRLH